MRYSARKRTRPPKRRRFFRLFVLLVICGVAFNYVRPLPHVEASLSPLASEHSDVQLAWPAQGAAALGADGFGTLGLHGPQTMRPTASIAKIITTLAVLEKHPLKPGEQGPALTLTRADVDLYSKYYNEGGSYVQVAAGEKITEYQALEAMLLPSANNMADSMAIWAFGSINNYLTYANSMVKHFGLHQTVVAADASGFSPETKSTPADLVRLGELAIANPVVAQIVTEKSAVIPVHGVIYSANSRLGISEVIGIKTGLTDEAGGCFLFASPYSPKGAGGKSVTIVGAIMGEPNLNVAMNSAPPLANSAKPYFSFKTAVKAGQVFGTLTTPWLASSEVVAKDDISVLAWRGAALTPKVKLASINRSLPGGTQVGTAIVTSGGHFGSAPLILQKAISGPTWQWRVKRL